MSEHGTDGLPAAVARPRLFDAVREVVRRRHYSDRTEETYLHWIKRFVYFSGKRHPRELGTEEVTAFLNHLVSERKVAAATQNQALAALLFLYKEVLAQPLPWLENIDHARRPVRKPTVLTRAEAKDLLARPKGTKWLMASLLYGAGLHKTSRTAAVTSSCRMRSPANTRAHRTNGGGSSSFRRTNARWTRGPVSSGGTMYTKTI